MMVSIVGVVSAAWADAYIAIAERQKKGNHRERDRIAASIRFHLCSELSSKSRFLMASRAILASINLNPKSSDDARFRILLIPGQSHEYLSAAKPLGKMRTSCYR
jgi:hypothetical protein